MGSGPKPANSPLVEHSRTTNPGGSRFKKAFTLERVGLVLSLLALLAAGVTIWLDVDVRNQATGIKTHVDDIASNVSTRYLPDWPEHAEYLTQLVSGVQEGDELVIQVDSIGYLAFSQPEQFNHYFDQLTAAAHRTRGKVEDNYCAELIAAQVTIRTTPK